MRFFNCVGTYVKEQWHIFKKNITDLAYELISELQFQRYKKLIHSSSNEYIFNRNSFIFTEDT